MDTCQKCGAEIADYFLRRARQEAKEFYGAEFDESKFRPYCPDYDPERDVCGRETDERFEEEGIYWELR
jgi:hypothetical protein